MKLTQQHGKDGLALLGSLCLFLSAIEYLIPKPMPFMRIGLANLPLLLALNLFGPKDFFLLVVVKILGQGIIGGTLFSYVFLFSCAGTFASAAIMYFLRRLLGKKLLSFMGIGCAGAMASNGIQLLLARYLIFGPALRFMAPPFLAAGFICGIALGLICEHFCRHSRWYVQRTRYAKHTQYAQHDEKHGACGAIQETAAAPCIIQAEKSLRDRLFNADELFIAGLAAALIFILNQSLPVRVIHFAFFFLLACFAGKKPNIALILLVMAAIVFCNLLAPYGKILASLGPLRITQGSLFSGLEKALTLQGLILLSRACIKPDLKLPGALGALLGEALRNMEFMRERKSSFKAGKVIARIDAMLLELEARGASSREPASTEKPKRNIKGILVLAAIVIATAAVGFLGVKY